MKRLSPLLLFVLIHFNSLAQAPPMKHIQITRGDNEFIIDGVINDDEWEHASYIDDFWQHWPVDTIPAIKRTEVKVSYDNEFIYVSAKCFDDKAQPIITSMKRDDEGGFWNSDGFSVTIDPGNNDTNGYFFAMNPRGIQVDATVSQRGANPIVDTFWDDYWLGEARITDYGYSYEMAIPFSSIKFDADNNQWGINFIRNDIELGAYDLWCRFPMDFSGMDFGYNGNVTFKDDVPKETKGKINIFPSVSGAVINDREADGKTEVKLNGGLDAKMAVGSNLSLDLSIYPDFSTVNVDRQYIDFYRFEYYMPEMRSFFLENGDLFSGFGTYTDHTTPYTDNRIKPLYTRRIGIYDWNYVPMTYGVRLSGNASEKVRIGVLNVQNEAYEDLSAQNYSATSFQWSVLKRSAIKGMFTNRQMTPDFMRFDKEDYNRTAGLEFDYMNNKGNWTGTAKYHHSFNPENYGKAAYLGAELNYNSSTLRVANRVYNVGDNYINDMGYVPRLYNRNDRDDTEFRQGFTELTNRTSYTFYPKNDKLLLIAPGNNFSAYTNPNGSIKDYVGHLNVYTEFESRSSINVFMNYEQANLLAPTDILKNDKLLEAGQYNFQSIGILYTSNWRKLFNYNLSAENGFFYNGEKTSLHLGAKYRVQPWGNFSFDYDYCNLRFPGDIGTEIYHLAALQAEITFKKDLSWTTLVQYNTQVDNMNVNSMLRWRFRPLSDFFIVVKNDRTSHNFSDKKLQVNFKLRYWLNL
ncbi:sugar-binding protein [Carboxylicivirga sp. N1Y90]|uniref:sugar-binding protein n=1 Tax=Carboxylicivirga fragile TaxID=3417571 RepID=UPI003D348F40|nr:carbohydrate binding family 9 domain-containing protein [Marinilabiliaceae bacterium N1Y90]